LPNPAALYLSCCRAAPHSGQGGNRHAVQNGGRQENPGGDLQTELITDSPEEAGHRFAGKINAKLAHSNKKVVFIYVRGYKVIFSNPILVSAEIWPLSDKMEFCVSGFISQNGCPMKQIRGSEPPNKGENQM